MDADQSGYHCRCLHAGLYSVDDVSFWIMLPDLRIPTLCGCHARSSAPGYRAYPFVRPILWIPCFLSGRYTPRSISQCQSLVVPSARHSRRATGQPVVVAEGTLTSSRQGLTNALSSCQGACLSPLCRSAWADTLSGRLSDIADMAQSAFGLAILGVRSLSRSLVSLMPYVSL